MSTELSSTQAYRTRTRVLISIQCAVECMCAYMCLCTETDASHTLSGGHASLGSAQHQVPAESLRLPAPYSHPRTIATTPAAPDQLAVWYLHSMWPTASQSIEASYRSIVAQVPHMTGQESMSEYVRNLSRKGV